MRARVKRRAMSNQLCQCHGEPSYWQRDLRCKAGGWWECAVKRRAKSKARYYQDPDARRAEVRDYYHDRGWLVKRRRALKSQRARITEQLDQLAEEAATC